MLLKAKYFYYSQQLQINLTNEADQTNPVSKINQVNHQVSQAIIMNMFHHNQSTQEQESNVNTSANALKITTSSSKSKTR